MRMLPSTSDVDTIGVHHDIDVTCPRLLMPMSIKAVTCGGRGPRFSATDLRKANESLQHAQWTVNTQALTEAPPRPISRQL